MKTVNVALLALIISAISSPVVLAGDTIEAAATELSAINSGMSQSEIEQKITRFLERTDNSPAAYTYLTEHHYIPSETPDTTQTPPVQTDPDAGQKTVAATGDVQTTARYQSMINARQSAVTDAQQQAQIVATQKTLAATGDTQNTAHYQEMINARLAAQNEANQRTTTEQGQKMNALTTDVAAQQQKERAQYDKQMQSLAQKSVQAHEQIDSLSQDVTQTQQQLTNTQKRVADNSQQINTLNNHFDSLKNEVEDNRKEANAGTASAIAIASQPQVKTGDVMMVSAGAGTFNGESAVSVGTSFNAGTHTVLKAGISADTQSDFGAGVGVGYSF